MADCRDIEIALAEGQPLATPELSAHLGRCEACRELAADDGALGRALGAPEGGADPAGLDVDAMFAELQQRLGDDRGAGAWLRARPTGVRMLLGAAVAVGAAAGLGLLLPGRDWSALPVARTVTSLAVLPVTAIAAVVMALWPLHRTEPSPRLSALVLALAVGAPAALALWPATGAVPAAEASMGLASKCFGLGALSALPVLLLVRTLDRSSRGVSTVLAGAAAGLAGTVGLDLGCVHTHPVHLLLGHATVAAVYVGVGAAIVAFRDRREI